MASIFEELDANYYQAPKPAAPSKYTLTSNDYAAVDATASKLGVSPQDLMTVINYETAGTMSPSIMGGKGGNYMGLIQFGPEERRTYGAHPQQSFSEQMGAVERYLKDRGLPQGADLSTIYRTINGGNPNAPLSASDGNGTIAQHVERMRAQAPTRTDNVFEKLDADYYSQRPAAPAKPAKYVGYDDFLKQARAANKDADEGEIASQWVNTYGNMTPPSTKRTGGEVVTDTLASVAKGVGSVIEGFGTLYGLGAGDMNNWLRELGKTTGEYWEQSRSAGLQERERQRKEKIDEADSFAGKAGQAIWQTIKDPALMSALLGENIAMLIPGTLVGRAVGMAGKAAGMVDAAGVASAGLRAAQTGTAIGSNALMQGADVASDAYDEALRMPQDLWDKNEGYRALAAQIGDTPAKESMARAMALQAGVYGALVSAGVNALPGMRDVEKLVVGTLGGTGKGILRGAATGTLKEASTEAVEEGAGKFFANQALRDIDPNRPLDKDVAEAAGLGAVGGGPFGAVAGGLGGARALPVEPPAPQPDPIQQAITRLDGAKTVEEATAAAADIALAPIPEAVRRVRASIDGLPEQRGTRAESADAAISRIAGELNPLPDGDRTFTTGSIEEARARARAEIDAGIGQAAELARLPEISNGPLTQEQALWMMNRQALENTIEARRAQAANELEAQKQADYDRLARESRLPAAEFDVRRDQQTGIAAFAEAPNAMQEAFRRAQERAGQSGQADTQAAPFAAPQTVSGKPVSDFTAPELQAIAANPDTPANTRHAAVAAIAASVPSRGTDGNVNSVQKQSLTENGGINERPSNPNVDVPATSPDAGIRLADGGRGRIADAGQAIAGNRAEGATGVVAGGDNALTALVDQLRQRAPEITRGPIGPALANAEKALSGEPVSPKLFNTYAELLKADAPAAEALRGIARVVGGGSIAANGQVLVNSGNPGEVVIGGLRSRLGDGAPGNAPQAPATRQGRGSEIQAPGAIRSAQPGGQPADVQPVAGQRSGVDADRVPQISERLNVRSAPQFSPAVVNPAQSNVNLGASAQNGVRQEASLTQPTPSTEGVSVSAPPTELRPEPKVGRTPVTQLPRRTLVAMAKSRDKRMSARAQDGLKWLDEKSRFDSAQRAAEAAQREENRRIDREAREAAERMKDTPSRDVFRLVRDYGGINKEYAADVAGDRGVRGLGAWARVFREPERNAAGVIAKGHGLDEIAKEFQRQGYMTQDELDENGPQIASDIIREAIAGTLEPRTESQIQKARENEGRAQSDREEAEAAMRSAGEEVTPENVESVMTISDALATLSREEVDSLDDKFGYLTNPDEFAAAVINYVKDKQNADNNPAQETVSDRQETGREEAGAQTGGTGQAQGEVTPGTEQRRKVYNPAQADIFGGESAPATPETVAAADDKAAADRAAEVPLTLSTPPGAVTQAPENSPRNQRDMFASPQAAPERPAPAVDAAKPRLTAYAIPEEMVIQVPVEIGETGKTEIAEMNARVAFNEARKRVKKYEALQRCMQ